MGSAAGEGGRRFRLMVASTIVAVEYSLNSCGGSTGRWIPAFAGMTGAGRLSTQKKKIGVVVTPVQAGVQVALLDSGPFDSSTLDSSTHLPAKLSRSFAKR